MVARIVFLTAGDRMRRFHLWIELYYRDFGGNFGESSNFCSLLQELYMIQLFV
jgi:hypothetical protein